MRIRPLYIPYLLEFPGAKQKLRCVAYSHSNIGDIAVKNWLSIILIVHVHLS
jgi:hypothetical protein